MASRCAATSISTGVSPRSARSARPASRSGPSRSPVWSCSSSHHAPLLSSSRTHLLAIVSFPTNRPNENPSEEHHGEISSGQLQDLPVGAARGDRAAREEHRLRVPPHRPRQSPRLVPRHFTAQEGAGAEHRRQGVAVRIERASPSISTRRSRRGCIRTIRGCARSTGAWTDYLPTFSEMVTGAAYSARRSRVQGRHRADPAGVRAARRRLEKQGAGPFFNGAKYSLVDAAYAPFLQRYYFLDRIKPLGVIEKFPRVKAWTDALRKRPSTTFIPGRRAGAAYRSECEESEDSALWRWSPIAAVRRSSHSADWNSLSLTPLADHGVELGAVDEDRRGEIEKHQRHHHRGEAGVVGHIGVGEAGEVVAEQFAGDAATAPASRTMPGQICDSGRWPAGSHLCTMNSATMNTVAAVASRRKLNSAHSGSSQRHVAHRGREDQRRQHHQERQRQQRDRARRARSRSIPAASATSSASRSTP